MAPRRPSARLIGATQAPELVPEELDYVEIDGLDARFELEDACVFSASLVKVDAGSGRIRRVHLKDVDLGESKLRAAGFLDVVADRIYAANGDWGGRAATAHGVRRCAADRP
jgi:hypothetical protein